jgi:hypothetical protein
MKRKQQKNIICRQCDYAETPHCLASNDTYKKHCPIYQQLYQTNVILLVVIAIVALLELIYLF